MKGALFISIFLFALSFSAIADDRYNPAVAVEVAAKDFQIRLNEERAPEVEYSKFTSDVNNYSVGISFNKENFVIIFIPKIEGFDIEGGGAKYIVRKSDMKIVKYIGYK